MYVCSMYVCSMYVCSMYVCMFVVCMHVCMYVCSMYVYVTVLAETNLTERFVIFHYGRFYRWAAVSPFYFFLTKTMG